MPGKWYIATNGRREGPLTSAELRKLIVSGRITGNDMLCDADTNAWAMAATLPIFYQDDAVATPTTLGGARAEAEVSVVPPTVDTTLPPAQGRDVPKDVAEAGRWYGAAADRGLASARDNLNALPAARDEPSRPNVVPAVLPAHDGSPSTGLALAHAMGSSAIQGTVLFHLLWVLPVAGAFLNSRIVAILAPCILIYMGARALTIGEIWIDSHGNSMRRPIAARIAGAFIVAIGVGIVAFCA